MTFQSMSAARWASALALSLLVPAASLAQSGSASEAQPGLVFLQRLQQAAHQLDYEGVYTYQQGAVLLSSRIVHLADAHGERQRVEVLDGRTHREFVRHNDKVQSLFPELRMVLVEQGTSEYFPVLFSGSPQDLGRLYRVQLEAEPGRVAGRVCDIAHIVPRDALRWRYWICADAETGLLLKVQTRDDAGGVLEQVAFSEVDIGADVDATLVEPRHDTAAWQHVSTGEPVDLAASGWHIVAPTGFTPISQLRRKLKHQQEVHQMVLSDGLAAVSVFIERVDARHGAATGAGNVTTGAAPAQGVQSEGQADSAARQGASHAKPGRAGAVQYGATNIYSRQEGDFWLTVLGEVPAETVRQVAEATTYRLRQP